VELVRLVREAMSRYVGWGRLGLGLERRVLVLVLCVVMGFEGVERTVQEVRVRMGRILKVLVGGVEEEVELLVGLELDAAAVGGEDEEGGMERTIRFVIGSAV
jgi:hypothetical protein